MTIPLAQTILPDNGSIRGCPPLATCEYPCQSEPFQPEPLVLLHGWGCDSRIWQVVLPELTQHLNVITIDLPGFGESEFFQTSPSQIVSSEPQPDLDTGLGANLENYLDSILAVLPERCSLMGWSLGGMLATVLASRHPSRFTNLITLASNPSFVQKKGWLSAMPKKTFAAFFEMFQQQPADCLKRFHGLQCQGDQHERNVLKALKALVGLKAIVAQGISLEGSDKSSHVAWLRGLELLTEIDNRDAIASLEVRGLHIFGEVDQLVPASAADILSGLNANQQVDVLESTGHIPHLSCPDVLTSKVIEFLKLERYHLDKKRVAKSFSRAAESYDSVARLQRKAGQYLLGLLPDKLLPDKPLASQIIDLGCGTGYFANCLANKYSGAELTGVDLAQGMLAFARGKCDAPVTWLCGDAECLPLADNSVDLVFSNLAFQWCEQLPVLAAEIARVLKPGGMLAFTSLGSKTLNELKQSWAEVDDYVHVNHFMDAQNWHQAFSLAGFNFTHFDVDDPQLEYRDLRHLTDELKGIGAHNLNSGQNRGLTSPEQVRALIQAYEKYRNGNGQLPATWEVIYGVATLEVTKLNV